MLAVADDDDGGGGGGARVGFAGVFADTKQIHGSGKGTLCAKLAVADETQRKH